MIGLGVPNGWTPSGYHVPATPNAPTVKKERPVSLVKRYLPYFEPVLYSPGFRKPPVPKFRETTSEMDETDE